MEKKTIESPTDEVTYRWPGAAGDEPELTLAMTHAAVAAHSILPTTKKISAAEKEALLHRCFDLAKPKIVMGKSYCRIHPDSVGVFKVIINQYFI